MPRNQTSERRQQPDIRALIEAGIRDGHYKPGDKLDEGELRQRFEVSRTPVREALLQLASKDLVVFRPRQGAHVAEMTVKEIAAMWEVLANLEGLCASLAVRRMTPEEVQAVQSVHERAAGTREVEAYADLNNAFHECFYLGCRNAYLARQVTDIRTRLKAYRRHPFERAGGIERSIAGHRAVVEALVAGDDQRADAAMREHVASGLSFLDLVANMPT